MEQQPNSPSPQQERKILIEVKKTPPPKQETFDLGEEKSGGKKLIAQAAKRDVIPRQAAELIEAGGKIERETADTITISVTLPKVPSDSGEKGVVALVKADTDRQLTLFGAFFNQEHNRTFTTADTLNRYVLTKRRELKTAKGSTKTYEAKGGTSKITAALFDEKIIFPGAFEQLVELVLRKMTIEQRAEMGLWQEKKSPALHHVSVTFSLAELRRRLAENGSERKLADIREALEVMSRCNWSCDTPLPARFVGELSGPILRIDARRKERREDEKGEKEMYLAYWHPLIAEAILSGDHFLLDNGILRLKDPLARWILNRLNARYRQAAKDDAISGKGYTLSLETILAESGIEVEVRLRATIERIRSALAELQAQGFLSSIPHPYEESPTYEHTATKPKVVGMTWVLFPSRNCAQNVIDGNKEAKARPVGKLGQGSK